AEVGIRDATVTGVQTCALPIYRLRFPPGEERCTTLLPNALRHKPGYAPHRIALRGWARPGSGAADFASVEYGFPACRDRAGVEYLCPRLRCGWNTSRYFGVRHRAATLGVRGTVAGARIWGSRRNRPSNAQPT